MIEGTIIALIESGQPELLPLVTVLWEDGIVTDEDPQDLRVRSV